jgi:hypothetical protein
VATPASVTRPRIALTGLTAGEGARLSIPFAAAAANVWRDYSATDRLTAAASLAELDASAGEKFHLAGGVLHLKLVAKAGRDYAAVHADPR